jgi:two-component system response regulator GlrR
MPGTGLKPKVLLVDDDPKLLRLLSIRLKRAGYAPETAASGKEALIRLSQAQVLVVVTDVRMEGMDGMALFDALHKRDPTLPVIILTAHGTIRDAVAATERGVFAYMTKPFDSEELVQNIDRAARLRGPVAPEGGESAAGRQEWCPELVTSSGTMRALLAQARKVALSDVNVLIQGESGTGKELLAKAIHRASPRNAGQFVAVNCSAIPDALFESEFFGHKRGAFTGATNDHLGLLAAASGGTLLLDEIADMPQPFQAKLLRALQEREIRPVGSTESIPIDLRAIAASHDDLLARVERREFREDLYYRLGVVTLEIPPLSARREDIPLLVERFLQSARLANDSQAVRGFSREALEILVGAPWPGNVRQLRNVVDHCVVLAATPLISADLVRWALRGRSHKLSSFSEARAGFELDYLIQLLQATKGNVTQAAKLADRNRSEFYSLLKKHKLDPEMFRDAAEPTDAPPGVKVDRQ